MTEEPLTYDEAMAKVEELRTRLVESEEALRAIRSGKIDALVVSDSQGERVYTLIGVERTYHTLVEAMNEGALVLSPEGIIIYSNRTFAAMLGAPLTEVIGASIRGFVVDSDVERLMKLLEQAPKRPGRKEISLKHAESGSVPALVSVGNLETDEGRAISAVVTDLREHKRTEAELQQYREHLEELVGQRTKQLAQTNQQLKLEIDQRKQAEEALRGSEWRLKHSQEIAHLGSWELDLANNRLTWSDEVYRIFGLEPREFGATYEAFLETVHPDDREAVDAAYSRSLREVGDTYEIENRVVRKSDGEVRVVHERCEHTRDETGRVVRSVGMVQDITDRKRVEEQLASSRAEAESKAAQLESFFASMADGLTLFDAAGNVIMINDTGRAVFGIPESAKLDDWSKYERYTLDGESIPIDGAATSRALRGEIVRNMRYRAVSPWGPDFIINASASPVRDSAGRIIGAVNVFRDVTDEVEFEQHRQELIEKEHHISEVLQEALIPSQIPYTVRGASIAMRYQPALREAQVGGDFYDVFDLDDGKIGVIIGDVAGKGLQAAVRVAAARHSIRSYAYLDPSPGKVMTLANDALSRDDSDVMNALTAFFAVVDTNTGMVSYASAGHEPPVVCKSGGGVEELEVTGTILGVFPGANYTEATYAMQAGDSLVMFTDGITEARDHASTLFDKSGVIERLARCCDAPPDDVAEALLESAVAHADGSLQDDAAIVVLGYSTDRQDRNE